MKTTTSKKSINKVIIVALAKFSSVMEDTTELEDSNAYKGNVKRDIERFLDMFNTSTRPMYSLYYKENTSFFEELISNFDNFIDQCDIKPDSSARMILIYSKLLSINMDLYSITMEDDKNVCVFARYISVMIDNILKKKFWNMYKTMKDPEGNGVETFTERIHHFGKMVYTDYEEVTE